MSLCEMYIVVWEMCQCHKHDAWSGTCLDNSNCLELNWVFLSKKSLPDGLCEEPRGCIDLRGDERERWEWSGVERWLPRYSGLQSGQSSPVITSLSPSEHTSPLRLQAQCVTTEEIFQIVSNVTVGYEKYFQVVCWKVFQWRKSGLKTLFVPHDSPGVSEW